MNKIALLNLFLLIAVTLLGQEWYVSEKGNDTNSGKTLNQAFRTLQKAADVVQPGETVWIDGGTYTSHNPQIEAVVEIKISGRPDAWITWKALPGHSPQIKATGWGGLSITGSYHIIDGISIIGANDSLTLIDALAEAKNEKPNPVYNTNGLTVDGRKNGPDNKPHHIIIRNCTVGKCPGGGITILEADYVTVEDCKVFNNAWYMRYAGSGITTLNLWRFDDEPGYHIIIQRNYVWNNKTLVPWGKIAKLSDGNGILLDVTDQQRNGATNPNADAAVTSFEPVRESARPVWKNRSLIANNVSVYNGGSGIHTFRTAHVDIINNTTYHNGQIVGYQELFPNMSEDIVILNNIIVPRPGAPVTSNNRNKNIRWDYNIYPVPQEHFNGPNDIIADPMFMDPHIDLMRGNFKLKKGSPALNSGTGELKQAVDINGKKRPAGGGIDRGAFEQ